MTNGISPASFPAAFVICHSKFIQMVARGQHHHALRSRQYFPRIHAFMGIAFEVAHFAVVVLREPILEFSGVDGRIRAGETAIVEPQFLRSLADFLFHPWDAVW